MFNYDFFIELDQFRLFWVSDHFLIIFMKIKFSDLCERKVFLKFYIGDIFSLLHLKHLVLILLLILKRHPRNFLSSY
jgi:hypothetical protein